MKKGRCFTSCLERNKKVVVKNRCHSKLDLESSTLVVSQRQQPAWKMLNQVQHDGLLFNNGHNAFTLIELLVVVLIIGILAAVALPQYNKAVEKSRSVRLFTQLKTIADAQEAYYLANGAYATDAETLSVKLPPNSGVNIGTGGFAYGKTDHIQLEYFFQHFTPESGFDPNTITCVASNQDALGLAVCKSFGGQLTRSNAGCLFGSNCSVWAIATR